MLAPYARLAPRKPNRKDQPVTSQARQKRERLVRKSRLGRSLLPFVLSVRLFKSRNLHPQSWHRLCCAVLSVRLFKAHTVTLCRH